MAYRFHKHGAQHEAQPTASQYFYVVLHWPLPESTSKSPDISASTRFRQVTERSVGLCNLEGTRSRSPTPILSKFYVRSSLDDVYALVCAIDDHRLRVYARFLKPTTGKITVGYHLLTTRSLPIATKSGSPKERNRPRPTETISFPSSFSERDRQFYLG